MQAIILIPVLVAQMCVYLVIAILRAVGFSIAQSANHNARIRQVQAESAPARARLEAQIASTTSAQTFEMSLLTGALDAASPVRQAKPWMRPFAFRKWAAMERNDVLSDLDAMAWVDKTFDPAGAVGRFKAWHSGTRSSLQGHHLQVFDRLFGERGTDVQFADRLEEAQYTLSLNAKFAKYPVDADFAHPAATMFVDRVRDIERMRAMIASYVEKGSTRAEAVGIVRDIYRAGNGCPVPKAV